LSLRTLLLAGIVRFGALSNKGISKEFDEWIAIAKDRSKWRQLTHSNPKPPDVLMPAG
jgi:hypothetical protein